MSNRQRKQERNSNGNGKGSHVAGGLGGFRSASIPLRSGTEAEPALTEGKIVKEADAEATEMENVSSAEGRRKFSRNGGV